MGGFTTNSLESYDTDDGASSDASLQETHQREKVEPVVVDGIECTVIKTNTDEEVGNMLEELFDDLADPRKVGSIYKDLNCLCKPTRAKPTEISGRVREWFAMNWDQVVSSIIVSIAIIPEAISYAVIARLPPSFALQSCWIACMMTAIIGGRPGMITSASGLTALLLCRLVNTDTVGASSIMYVPLVVGFAGVLHTASAFFGFGRLAANFSHPITIGMVNGLAILALALQCRYMKMFPLNEADMHVGTIATGSAKAVEIEWNIPLFSYFGVGLNWIQPWDDFYFYIGEVVVAFAITMYFPKSASRVPAPIMAMCAVLVIEYCIARPIGFETPLIFDYGGAQVTYPWTTVLSSEYSLPSFHTFETWKIVTGYGCALFATQFVETAISLRVVNQLDESDGPGFLVLFGQGISNVLIGFMGGMGANGSVTLSVLADRTNGTTCFSTFLTGALLFVFMCSAYQVINIIPLSAISGIMIATAYSLIQWRAFVAVFTACLPCVFERFVFDRMEVCIILFTAAACLIVDVSSLAIFVFAVVAYLFQLYREWRYRVDDKTAEAESTEEHSTKHLEEDPSAC